MQAKHDEDIERIKSKYRTLIQKPPMQIMQQQTKSESQAISLKGVQPA